MTQTTQNQCKIQTQSYIINANHNPITVAIFAGANRLPIEAVSEADSGVQGQISMTSLALFALSL